MSIKMSLNKFFNSISWIKGDEYNYWYRALDIFGSSLIVEVAKPLVDAKASSANAPKNKEIMAEIAIKAQEEFFCPFITKLLLTHMIFAMDSLDFFQDSLYKIVICKKNSMRILFNPVFNLPILSSSWGKNILFF